MSDYSRPTWDEYFLALSETASMRADCRRRKVGATLVGPDNRVIAHGYNGAIPGLPGCLEGACPRGLLSYSEVPAGAPYTQCIATHAEANALRSAPPERVSGSTMYINTNPCDRCIVVMRSAGVIKIIWPDNVLFL